MVLHESVKKRLGSCEKVTMKLRSLLNISSLGLGPDKTHRKLEEQGLGGQDQFRYCINHPASAYLLLFCLDPQISRFFHKANCLCQPLFTCFYHLVLLLFFL